MSTKKQTMKVNHTPKGGPGCTCAFIAKKHSKKCALTKVDPATYEEPKKLPVGVTKRVKKTAPSPGEHMVGVTPEKIEEPVTQPYTEKVAVPVVKDAIPVRHGKVRAPHTDKVRVLRDRFDCNGQFVRTDVVFKGSKAAFDIFRASHAMHPSFVVQVVPAYVGFPDLTAMRKPVMVRRAS